jgi:copper chaperone CopZ
MKTLVCAAGFATALLAAPGGGHAPAPQANATNRFAITGMTCSGCAKGVAGELKLTPGVITAEVTLSNNLAVVTFDTNRVTTARLIKAVEEAGFKASLKSP